MQTGRDSWIRMGWKGRYLLLESPYGNPACPASASAGTDGAAVPATEKEVLPSTTLLFWC